MSSTIMRRSINTIIRNSNANITTRRSLSIRSTSTVINQSSSRSLLAAVGVSAAATVSILLSSQSYHSTSIIAAAPSAVVASVSKPLVSAKAPPIDLQSKLSYTDYNTFANTVNLVLYQYQTCPFCNKVRAYLDSINIPYTVVEVNPLTKAQLKFSQEYKKVPVLTIDSIQLNDSTQIITTINNYIQQLKQQSNNNINSNSSESEWRDWVDNSLLPLTAPNLYRNWSESLESFSYINEQSEFPKSTQLANKYIGAAVMYLLSKYKLKKKYSITDEREAIYRITNQQWINTGLNKQQYRGGSAPDLSDISAFGVYRSLMGFSTGKDLLNSNNTSIEFINWYKRMESIIGNSRAKNASHNTTAANFRTQ